MDRYDIGTAATFQINYVDESGNALTPTAVSYAVYDEVASQLVLTPGIGFYDEGVGILQNDQPVGGSVTVVGPWISPQTITIPGGFNATAGGRQVIFAITSAAGVNYVTYSYRVLPSPQSRLVLLVNTFQTFLAAQVVADDIPNLPAWGAASDNDRTTALIEAYRRLTRFGYLIKWPEYVDTQNIYLQDIHARITPQMWPVMTTAIFAPYPLTFQEALAKAQVVEANHVLTSDPITYKRSLGLLAESVGESKMMFKGGIRPLDMGVSKDTLVIIRPYLDYRVTLTRAP